METSTYEAINAQFYHGQFTQFVRQLMDSLELLIESDRLSEILYYLNDESDLTLPVKRKG